MNNKWLSWWNSTCSVCGSIRHVVMTTMSIYLFAASAYAGYWIWAWTTDNKPAIELSAGTASAPFASVGDTLVFFQPVTKFRDCPGRIVQTLSGPCGNHMLHDNAAYLPAGFVGRPHHPVRIPFEAIPGECSWRVKATYVCNPMDLVLGRQIFESPPIPFEVRPYQESPQ